MKKGHLGGEPFEFKVDEGKNKYTGDQVFLSFINFFFMHFAMLYHEKLFFMIFYC